ncbi:MAG: HEAT repeat domain-containing protein [Pirellulales bacterium]
MASFDVVRRWFSASILLMAFVAPARAQVPPEISAELRAYVKDYPMAGTTLRAGFVPYRSEVVWGEPLEVTLTMESLGPGAVEFQFGGDYRGAGRHNRIRVEIADAAGQQLADPNEGLPDMGGFSSEQNLVPGGEVFNEPFSLTRYRKIERPGDYQVSCTFALDDHDFNRQGPAKPVVTSNFQLRILERTPERVTSVLDRMVDQLQSARDEDLPRLMSYMVEFDREGAESRLIRLAQQGPLPRRTAAYSVLGQVQTDQVMAVAIAGLHDPEPAIRSAAAGTLGSFRTPQAVAALLAGLPDEQHAVTESLLIALGQSQSEEALPAITSVLQQGTPELKLAAVKGLVAWGGTRAAEILESHIKTDDLALRATIAKALVEDLRVPLRANWILPVMMGRRMDSAWHESLRMARMYGGEEAIPMLVSCLDFDVPWSYRNWWIIEAVKACTDAPQVDYAYDPNSNGTPSQWEANERVLWELNKISGPGRRSPVGKKPLAAELEVHPQIDFEPKVSTTEQGAKVASGFLTLSINRNGYTLRTDPSAEALTTYQLVNGVRQGLTQRERLETAGVTAEQLERLQQVVLPAENPADPEWTNLYIAYREAPPGEVRQAAESELGESVRKVSHSHYQAYAAAAEAIRTILTAEQIQRIRAE